jgi:5-methylthioadenosine/S-adenosylhomocysteine deaminase
MLLLAKWVLPISALPIQDGGVLVRDGLIERVGPRDSFGEIEHEDVRDFGQAVVMPGFVDLHTHLAYSAFRGLCDDLPYAMWKLQVGGLAQRLDEHDWQASARLGALEAMRSGITCVANISPDRWALEAMLESGLRGIAYREVEGMGASESRDNLAEAVRFLDAASERAAQADGRISVGIAPHSPYSAGSDVYTGCTRIAKERWIPIATHLAGSRDEYEFVKYGSSMLANEYRVQKGWEDVPWQPTGVSPVKYVQQWQFFTCENVLIAHGIHVSDDDIQVLERYDVAIAHCPRCAAKLGMGIAPLKEFTRAGLRVGLGTDSPASNNTMDPFDEMRIGLLVQRAATLSVEGLSAERFVRTATLGGAEALKLDGRIGSLEPGKEADLIAVDLSHSHQLPTTDPYSALVYTANQEDVSMTMVAGRVLFEGTARTLPRDEVVAEAEPVRAKLRG